MNSLLVIKQVYHLEEHCEYGEGNVKILDFEHDHDVNGHRKDVDDGEEGMVGRSPGVIECLVGVSDGPNSDGAKIF